MYLPALLRRPDICQQSFRKTEPALSLPLTASDYLRCQVKFTPFPNERLYLVFRKATSQIITNTGAAA